MNPVALSDSELFSAVKQNDMKAFYMLYNRYWALVYKKAFAYLNDADSAREIVNDIFLNIWVKRDLLNILVFDKYLTAAARYRVYNVLREKRNNNISYVEDYQKFENLSTEKNIAEYNLSVSEINSHVGNLLNELPRRCKEIFLLSRMTNLSNEEIAAKLSISRRTVENQISLAIKHLRRHFAIFVILAACVIMCVLG